MGKVFLKLFEPVNIGKVTIKNRIAMAPMAITGLVNPDGSLERRGIDYYIERAKGGVGLIISGVFKVENDIEPLMYLDSPLFSQVAIPSFAELSEAVHSFGTKIFVQLTAGNGRVAVPAVVRGRPVSASATPNYWDPTLTCKELTTEEVEKLIKAFGEAAMLLKMAGIDGIELHGHEGYLFDQFTTAIWNRRTDKFGGDLKGRLTFPVEILNIIKKMVGGDFPVQYRFGLKHYIKGLNTGILPGEEYKEGGRDIDEGLEMAELLEKAGFDALHVDAGCYESWYWAHPPMYQEHGCMVDMAEKVKKVVQIPVLTVGRLGIPELAEKIIEEGKADIVALGRALLADPDWPIKVQEGRIEDIRPCLGCHDGCMGRISELKSLSCAVNPANGRERLYELRPASKSKRVLVAGGGVAGMEAARVAAIRGHEVTLYEKGESLGGHLIEASVPDFKKDLERLISWYKTQLKKLGVEVKLETEVTPELVERENPDEVFIATGSNPIIPDIPGIERPNVATCIDLLLGKKEAGGSVLVVGGGLVGCEIALWLAKQGKKVTVVEMLPEVMTAGLPVPHENRIMLLDLLAVNNVEIIANAVMQEVTVDGVIITGKTFKRRAIKADTVALAVGLKADDKLYNSLRREVTHLHALGDCREPGNIMGAIWDSYEVARVT